jgi:two-component system response regulator TctD
MPMKALIVEDNQDLVSLLIKNLNRAGFSADSVDNAGDAALALATTDYAAVVLDLGLPGQDGLSLLRELRSRGDSTPVLVLTARDGVTDRVTGLSEGADDYMTKPFAMEELIARLRALSRRPDNLFGRRLTFGNVALDTETRQVLVGDAGLSIPAREIAVLEILLRRSGRVAPKRLFEDDPFGLSDEVGSNGVEVHVHRLRKILADAGATVMIHTVRGVGYLLTEDK